MKKFVLLAGAAAMLPMAAHAQDTAQLQTSLNGTVPQTCFIADTPTSTGYAQFTAGGSGPATSVNGNSVDFPASFVDATTAAADWPDYNGSNINTSGTTRINFNAVCNFANSTVQVSTAQAGLRLQNPPANIVGEFSNAISYQAELKWNGDKIAEMKTGPSSPGNGGGTFVGTANGSVSGTVAAATNAPMQLNIKLRKAHRVSDGSPVNGSLADRQAAPLLAGNYTDTVTVRFGANP